MRRPECRAAVSADDVAAHHRIRHAVFVVEQGVFGRSDVDARDADPQTVKGLGWVGGEPAGAVRLYPLDAPVGAWQGDRLAVLRAHRPGLGGRLVRFAVATAAARGGREMVAHVQVANVRFFERLGWECRGGTELYVGLPHQLMAIDLTRVAADERLPGDVGGVPLEPVMRAAGGLSPTRR